VQDAEDNPFMNEPERHHPDDYIPNDNPRFKPANGLRTPTGSRLILAGGLIVGALISAGMINGGSWSSTVNALMAGFTIFLLGGAVIAGVPRQTRHKEAETRVSGAALLSPDIARELAPAPSDWQRLEPGLTSTVSGDGLKSFIDGNPHGLAELDENGRFVIVNAVLADWLGHKPEDLVNRRHLVEFLYQGENSDGLVVSTGDVILKDGNDNPFPAHINSREGDRPGSRRITVRELTGERELEETLRQAEEGFRRFFDYAPVGIVMVDGDGVIVETNPAFQTMANLEGDGRAVSFLDLVQPADISRVFDNLQAARRGEHPDKPLEVSLGSDGSKVVQLYARRTDGSGQRETPSDLIVYIVDTTEIKNLETQIAQSQKMQAVGQLAGGIAHDFNNLLTAMIGFSDLLLQRHSPGDQSFGDIMQIKQNANRAANLVRQLLAFSRRQTLQPKILNLTDVLAELSHLIRRLIGENIELQIIHARDVGLIRVDQGQLEQVVINLAVNARDAMQGGGTLTIRSANANFLTARATPYETIPAGHYVVIEVTDTGTGIAASVLEKIFEPFFTTKEVGAGTGLGLSTVYGIIKQTGGFIVPESTEGEGATFRIYLPQYEPGENVDDEAVDDDQNRTEEPADLTGKATILLVEDEDPVRLFATRALQNKGYTVLAADCAEEAMEIVEDHEGEIDLAITDVVMPQMDGPAFIAWLIERQADIRVIYISGYAEDAFRNTIAGDRPYDFLPKPFSLKELAVKVKDVLSA
jgi:two-component system, cell cycle sensor histidine kinase and response regulator CckA